MCTQLLCRLLDCACHHGVPVPGVDKLLHAEIAWLQMVKVRTYPSPPRTTDEQCTAECGWMTDHHQRGIMADVAKLNTSHVMTEYLLNSEQTAS